MLGTGTLRMSVGGLIVASLIAGIAGCSSSPGQAASKRVGPVVTLHVGVYGSPGYQQSGLYAEYERLHPNIRIGIHRLGHQPVQRHGQPGHGAVLRPVR